MDVVLELAHLVEDAGDSPNKIPSKERLVEKIVFNISDIVMITALNVDLDYALKGSVLFLVDSCTTRHVVFRINRSVIGSSCMLKLKREVYFLQLDIHIICKM